MNGMAAFRARGIKGVRIHVLPVFDVRLWHASAVEMVVDVVEARAVRGAVCPGRLDNLPAEPTPKTRLKVASHSTLGELLLENVVLSNAMVFLQVGLEQLSPKASFPALVDRTIGRILVAAPKLGLKVLAGLVPLPVVFAAKCLVAPGKGARIGSCMALSVFSGLAISKRN
jgi:hypothetical protein